MSSTCLCKNCQKSSAEDGYEFEYCASCRDILCSRPIPPMILGVAIIITVILPIMFSRFMTLIPVAKEFKQAQSFSKQKRYDEAIKGYRSILSTFKKSKPARIDLIQSLFMSGRVDEAYDELDLLENVSLSKYEYQRIKDAERYAIKKFKVKESE